MTAFGETTSRARQDVRVEEVAVTSHMDEYSAWTKVLTVVIMSQSGRTGHATIAAERDSLGF